MINSALPTEILYEIFSYLSLEERLKFSKLSKTYRNIAANDVFWSEQVNHDRRILNSVKEGVQQFSLTEKKRNVVVDCIRQDVSTFSILLQHDVCYSLMRDEFWEYAWSQSYSIFESIAELKDGFTKEDRQLLMSRALNQLDLDIAQMLQGNGEIPNFIQLNQITQSALEYAFTVEDISQSYLQALIDAIYKLRDMGASIPQESLDTAAKKALIKLNHMLEKQQFNNLAQSVIDQLVIKESYILQPLFNQNNLMKETISNELETKLVHLMKPYVIKEFETLEGQLEQSTLETYTKSLLKEVIQIVGQKQLDTEASFENFLEEQSDVIDQYAVKDMLFSLIKWGAKFNNHQALLNHLANKALHALQPYIAYTLQDENLGAIFDKKYLDHALKKALDSSVGYRPNAKVIMELQILEEKYLAQHSSNKMSSP